MPWTIVPLILKSGHSSRQEGPTSHFRLPDHYMQVLVCQHECVRELATRPGRLSPIENFLPLHFDYLQFAYYRGKTWLIPKTCEGGVLLIITDIVFSSAFLSLPLRQWGLMCFFSHLTPLQLRPQRAGETTSGQML